MFKNLFRALCPCLCMMLLSCSRGESTEFNDGWKFVRDSLIGAEAVCYDDIGWKEVNLPHDFSLEPLPEGEFTLGSFSRETRGGGAVAYMPGGTGWYRKHFRLPRADAGKSVRLVFDGAYMETDVWVNGVHATSHKNGYTPFYTDITRLLSPAGTDNVVAVKVVNYGRNSRWYSGSGLYRGVELVVSDLLHIAQWGTSVTTPQVSEERALVHLDINVENSRKKDARAGLRVRIFDADDREVANGSVHLSIPGFSSESASLDICIDNPALWGPDSPSLYTAEVQVAESGRVVDVSRTRFGIRSIEVNVEEGLKLNGEPLLLKGGCVHHDNGLLGAEVYRAAEYRRVRLLKNSGFNAVRCAHNPPSSLFLDACDELGLLVVDEFTDMWEQPKNYDDYSRFFRENWAGDLTSMILRDRNHPSVVIWSIGNETPNWSIADASRIGKALTAKVRETDPTRPVTQGVTSAFIHREWDNSARTFEHLDIAGYNYLIHFVESDHEKYPDRVIMGTESYPIQAWKYWNDVVEKPYVIGDFVWTALDHLGESGMGTTWYDKPDNRDAGGAQFQISPGPEEGLNQAALWISPYRLGPEFPVTYTNFCGDIDLIGDKKAQGRYRDVMWDISPLELLVHEPVPEGKVEKFGMWCWPREEARWYWPGYEGERLQVRVFSKAAAVRLELNGERVGVKSPGEDYVAVFDAVEYRPGVLAAVALDADGRELARRELRTPGKPAAVHVVRECGNAGDELVYFKIEVTDSLGTVVPEAFPLSFDIRGAGFMSAGNGGPDDMASFRSRTPSTWRGEALLIVRPDGPDAAVEVSVSSEGLQTGISQ